jgi:hypothetical protein
MWDAENSTKKAPSLKTPSLKTRCRGYIDLVLTSALASQI